MKLKKTLFTSVAAVALMSVGAEMVQQNTSGEVVQAAKKKSKKATKKTLKRNAAIYNSKGKRVGKKTLKKGKKVKILGSKTIKGKKYYKISSNKFVKQANFKKLVKKATKKSTKKSKLAVKKQASTQSADNDSDDEDENDPIMKKYEGWLKKGKGALVATRDVKDIETGDVDYKKGDVIDVDSQFGGEETGVDVIKEDDGKYYFDFYGPDGSTEYSVDDFSYNPYKSSKEYKDYVSKVKKYTNKDLEEVRFVLNKSLSLHDKYYSDEGEYAAGETITITDPSVVLNSKGEYCIEGNDNHDNYTDFSFTAIDHFISPSSYTEDEDEED